MAGMSGNWATRLGLVTPKARSLPAWIRVRVLTKGANIISRLPATTSATAGEVPR